MGRPEVMVGEIGATLEAALPHLASKAGLAGVRTNVADLAEKPSKAYLRGGLSALLTARACNLAALAILK